MDSIPNEVSKIIIECLVDDVASIVRLSLSSKTLFHIIDNDPILWKKMYQVRWTKGIPLGQHQRQQHDGTEDENNDSEAEETSAKEEYQHRHILDARALQYVSEMAFDLRNEIGGEMVYHLNSWDKVGEPWEHTHWKKLLMLRWNVHDALKSVANRPIDYDKNTLNQNLVRFLASRSLLSIHLLECLHEWRDITMLPDEDELNRDIVLERFALLAVKCQMTPPELLDESIPIEQVVQQQLDDIAAHCQSRISERDERSTASSIKAKLVIINKTLFEELGFGGNEADYYNYRNSLLNFVIETKKGIPITLAILYTCVCRRLNICVDMIGLPGHLVLGFVDDGGNRLFMDVFRGGQILTLTDCQQIVMMYGYEWQESFGEPLDPYQVFHRILNNLSNCHGQRRHIRTVAPPFQEILSFQERMLMIMHREPRIAGRLLERLWNDLPLTMHESLLKLYGLLSTPHVC